MSDQTLSRPGRPQEDQFLRRVEIYEAVVPLIALHGARALTMRAAATAASMSVGGLNHYFPTRRDLLFFPLLPSTCAAHYEHFVADNTALRQRNPEGFLRLYLSDAIEKILLSGPAMQAAVDLGAGDFWEAIEQGMMPLPIVNLIEEIRGELPADARDRLLRAIRRSFYGALLDPRVTHEELSADIWRLLDAFYEDHLQRSATVA